jgi:acetyl esterase
MQESPCANQLLFYPVTDAAMDTPSFGEFAQVYLLTREMMHWCWRQYLLTPEAARHPAASPLRQRELAGTAPATIVLAGFDPLRDEGRAYAEALRLAGVSTTVRE